jgi:uracil-DNA glycosylase
MSNQSPVKPGVSPENRTWRDEHRTAARLRRVTPRPLAELVEPGWATALEPVAERVASIGEFLRNEVAAGRGYLPAGENVLRAFTQPLDAVRVLVVGQDPYPTPGHPIGLSFSVAPEVRPIPRSLHNIFRELVDDLGVPRPSTGDLSPWAEQGVLLLNRVLTVTPGLSGAHRGKGWEHVTDQAIRALAGRGGPLVAILWGRDAQSLRPLLGNVPRIESAHPSPMSADRGFFGSRPFSRANALLVEQGGAPIDWRLP